MSEERGERYRENIYKDREKQRKRKRDASLLLMAKSTSLSKHFSFVLVNWHVGY